MCQACRSEPIDKVTLLVRPEGLEPPAYWFEASRSIQLSYGRTMAILAGRCDPVLVPSRRRVGLAVLGSSFPLPPTPSSAGQLTSGSTMSMRPPLSARTPIHQTGAAPVIESVPFCPAKIATLFDIVTVPCC